MVAGMLRDDLLSLPGVAGADLEGDEITPSGVRVRLVPGVDAAVVGDEIERVLSLHGLRPEVVDSPTSRRDLSLDEGDEGDDEVEEVAEATSPVGAALRSVQISEGYDGVFVKACADGESASVRAAGATGAALDQAVVNAVAELAGTVSTPLIRSVDVREIGGVSVVTIVVDEAGDRLVGSAIAGGGRAYAVGRATWSALCSR